MLVMTKDMTPWHETAGWLRGLATDADIYRDVNLAIMVRLARRGCPVSLANASTIHERIMGRA
jgi:hypothetical protein